MGDRLWVGISSRYVTSQLGQLSLASSGVAKPSTSFGWGKGWNVTSTGWQVTLLDRTHMAREFQQWCGDFGKRTAIRVTLLSLLLLCKVLRYKVLLLM